MKRIGAAAVFAAAMLCAATSSVRAEPVSAAAQVTFEQTIADLKSPDVTRRLRAVTMLKASGYPEAATPLAGALADDNDDVRAQAIEAELNIFLAQRATVRRRVALIVELRDKIDAGASFAAGRSIVGATLVPRDVATALCRTSHDAVPEVAMAALYAFGTLGGEVAATDRRDVLRACVPEIAALLGARDADVRLGALRVSGRVFERRPGDDPVDPTLGDAVVGTLNDKDPDVRAAAMDALGAMRYARSVQALTERFEYHRRGADAENALVALARIGNPASLPLMTARLSSHDKTLETIAIEGLARIGDASALPAIQTALADERSDQVLLAGWFASAALANTPIQSILDSLTRPKLHDQAFAYLAELAPGRSRLFVQSAADPDARTRTDVADILGMSGDPRALAIVEPLAQDADPQAARAAARAIARLRAAR